MKLPMHQVDAFTSAVFGGNPAAVVLLEEWLADETLQAIAAENNLSETAFVLSKNDSFDLRWFTPLAEIDLCGHATLATAYVLFELGRVRSDVACFETRSGRLEVRKSDDLLMMDFPARSPAPVECTEELIDALGARPNEVHSARDLLVVFESEAAVAGLAPRFDRLLTLDAYAVIATAPGDQVDFVSRFFAPKVGIAEDPVTGSAHCTLIPFWAERLGRTKLQARQISKRGGELQCEHCGDRVTIAGRVAPYLRGEITI